MKLVKIELTPPIVAISVAIGFAFAGFADELYVSDSGTYRTDDGVDHEAYTDLREAVAATAKSGDTIWVEDGYVYDSGADTTARIYVTKGMTIRSRSGKWETGATIVADSTARCIGVSKTGAAASLVCGDLKLIGFTLRSSGGDPQYGAVYVADGWARFDLVNCRITGFSNNNPVSEAEHTGEKAGIAHSTMRNCLYDGNANLYPSGNSWGGKSTNVSGCDVYDSTFRFNEGIGGGSCYATSISGCVVSNCTFVCNTNGSANVGGAMCITDNTGSFRCYDCNFVSNTFVRNITHGAHVRGYGRFERCKFLHGGWRQCSGAVKGYGTRGLTLVDCIVSNNVAEASGGVHNVYATNTVIACNSASASGYGGGAFDSYLVDCDLVANSCTCGAGARACVLVDCRIFNNTNAVVGGGAYACVLTNCLVYGNKAERTVSSGDMGGAGLAYCTATVCRVTGNMSIRNGAGTFGGLLTDCLIDGNTVDDPSLHDKGDNQKNVGTGGGVYKSDLVGCVVSNNVAWYRGAGYAGNGTTKNCTFVDNRLLWDFNWNGGQYMNGGSAIMGGTHYNALIVRNSGVGKFGSTISSWSSGLKTTLVNCTVVGNTSAKAAGGVDDKSSVPNEGLTVLVNTIIAGNTGKKTDSYKVATNCYVTASGLDNADVGCFYGNEPKLGTVEGFAYTPLGGSKCKNNALKLDWMTNETDVCSKDIYGHDRIMGSAPDIGAVERKGYGIMLLVR